MYTNKDIVFGMLKMLNGEAGSISQGLSHSNSLSGNTHGIDLVMGRLLERWHGPQQWDHHVTFEAVQTLRMLLNHWAFEQLEST